MIGDYVDLFEIYDEDEHDTSQKEEEIEDLGLEDEYGDELL